jgi:hypothetical protein
MSEIIGFDLEIAEPFPEDRWDYKAKLGISCAAVYSTNAKYHKPYYPKISGGRYGDRMSEEEVMDMVGDLLLFESQGNYIVTWNGLGFDFLVLALELSDPRHVESVKQMAIRHIDPFFNMFCDRGFGIGLQKAAEGLGVGGKLGGMHGSIAPLMWNADFPASSQDEAEKVIGTGLRRGSKEAQDLCIKYVIQDAKATHDIYQALLSSGEMYWITGSGRRSSKPWYPRIKNGRLYTCHEANALPEPDTSWMDSPWPRSKFTGWIT